VALNTITLTLKLVINNSIGIRYKDMIKKIANKYRNTSRWQKEEQKQAKQTQITTNEQNGSLQKYEFMGSGIVSISCSTCGTRCVT
jgi:hypothetical protein